MLGSFRSALRLQARVIGALILRDMHSRHGDRFFGYFYILLSPLWRLCFLMTVFIAIRHRSTLLGTSPAVFWGTGILPYILCLYPNRMIMTSVQQGRSLLYFPIVKSFDIILARGILEIATALWVTVIFCIVLLLFGVDIVPLSYSDLMAAILASIFLGFSMGWINAVIYSMMPAWGIVVAMTMLVMYFTAGIFFLPTTMPQQIQDILWFNPLLHAVEWFRSAYFEGYGYGLLDRTYLLSFALVLLFCGTLLERLLRGKMLER
jgi:capsular polysaccharide transport system permease protein